MAVLKKALHFSTLAFTAYWLLATSRPRGPARDCFAELKHPAIEITLGPIRAPSDASVPSCQALDGLQDGAVLRVGLGRGPARPELPETEEACWGYDVNALDGPVGLSKLRSVYPTGRAGGVLFEAEATFTKPQPTARCPAFYRLSLAPLDPIPAGSILDPLRAGPAEPWRVRRVVRLDQSQGCPPLTALAATQCEDTFEVRSIAGAP